MPSIFVSYRRTDAPAHAGRIYDRLVERFGGDNVYRDLDSTVPGADFAEVIDQTIARCDALVAVIGRDWLSATRRWSPRRQMDDSRDWVRREIAAALERNIRVVPVLVEGARMPSPDELPEDVQMLARRHAVELTETAWTPQLTQLIDSLAAPPPTAPPHGARTALSEPPHGPRRTRAASRRLRAVAAVIISCGLTVGIAGVLVDGGDNHGDAARAGNQKAGPTGSASLSADEYRLQVIKVCNEHKRGAQRIKHAEGDRPLAGQVLPLETADRNKLKALHPPKELELDHRSVLALWGRRLSLLGYYYDNLRQKHNDPDFMREFDRQLKRVDRLTRKLQKHFVALGVTPECDFFT